MKSDDRLIGFVENRKNRRRCIKRRVKDKYIDTVAKLRGHRNYRCK